MRKYVLSILVKPKLKNRTSVLCYRLPRFRNKVQNQRVATFWRHKSIEIDRLNYKLVSIMWSIQKQEQDLIWQKFSVQMHGCLHGMRKCCIFRCAENRCWGCRELKWVWLRFGLLFWHTFGTVCCFFTRIYLQYIARPVESDRPMNIVFVRPSVLPL